MRNNSNKITIIDYGVSNICNIEKAAKLFSENVLVTNNPAEIENSSSIIFPGVGSFKSGMEELKKHGLIVPIKKFAETGKPILGICLGAQLLMSKGFEMGEAKGLNLIPGNVVPFPKLPSSYKLPNIGWRSVYLNKKNNNPALRSFKISPEVYFVHSYVIIPDNPNNVLATTEYGGYKFCAIMGSNNIYGTQFHPERSGKFGLKLIEDFIKLTKKDHER
jgi:imidazole glycerol-phosphate synthase subunit HisH